VSSHISFRRRGAQQAWLATLGLLVFTAGLMLAWHSALGEWTESQAFGRFAIRSEMPLSPTEGDRLLDEMAQLQADVEHVLQLPNSGKPVQVNLFQSRGNYLKSLQPQFSQASNRSALYIQQHDGGQIYLYRHPGYERDLRHECTHAVLHNVFRSLPLWLDEGLAEYFEMPAGERLEKNPQLLSVAADFADGQLVELEQLEQLDRIEEFQNAHYRASWAWTHFLLNGPPPIQQALREYLSQARSAPAGRLSDWLQAQLPDFQQQFAMHIEPWTRATQR
jgi:hypothetical protein